MPTPNYFLAGVWISRLVPTGWEHLQLLRSPGRYMPNVWSLCRGGIEPGETAVQAALREIREETSLTPSDFHRMGTLEQFYSSETDTIWHVPFFWAQVPPSAIVTLNPEHTAYRWLPDPTAELHLTWPSEIHLLAEVRRFFLHTPPSPPHPTTLLTRIPLPLKSDL